MILFADNVMGQDYLRDFELPNNYSISELKIKTVKRIVKEKRFDTLTNCAILITNYDEEGKKISDSLFVSNYLNDSIYSLDTTHKYIYKENLLITDSVKLNKTHISAINYFYNNKKQLIKIKYPGGANISYRYIGNYKIKETSETPHDGKRYSNFEYNPDGTLKYSKGYSSITEYAYGYNDNKTVNTKIIISKYRMWPPIFRIENYIYTLEGSDQLAHINITQNIDGYWIRKSEVDYTYSKENGLIKSKRVKLWDFDIKICDYEYEFYK